MILGNGAMSVVSEKAPEVGEESSARDNPVAGPGHYSSDISQRNRPMAINDTHFIIPRPTVVFRAKPHKLLCGLNAINNCFGYKLADIEDMNCALRAARLQRPNEFHGVEDVGDLSVFAISRILCMKGFYCN
jgi:hypothetical protein